MWCLLLSFVSLLLPFYFLPDGTRSNNLWRGCEGSFAMFSTLLLQWLWRRSWTEGREAPMTLSAHLTLSCLTHCSWSTMLTNGTSECCQPGLCRKSWGCWRGEGLISASPGIAVIFSPWIFQTHLKCATLWIPKSGGAQSTLCATWLISQLRHILSLCLCIINIMTSLFLYM